MNSTCVGFVFDKASGSGCWLKDVFTTKSSDSSKDTYYLESSRIYVFIPSTDSPGSDLGFADIPFAQCSQQCDNTPNCIAFALKLDATQGCWLKSSLGGSDFSDNTNRDIYYAPDGKYIFKSKTVNILCS